MAAKKKLTRQQKAAITRKKNARKKAMIEEIRQPIANEATPDPAPILKSEFEVRMDRAQAARDEALKVSNGMVEKRFERERRNLNLEKTLNALKESFGFESVIVIGISEERGLESARIGNDRDLFIATYKVTGDLTP